MNKKIVFAILGVFLMTSGIFSLVAYIPAGTIGSPQSSPALSNVGETATTSVAVNYWTQAGVANSGTTSFDMPYSQNSSQNSYSYDSSPGWHVYGYSSSNGFDEIMSTQFNIGYFYYYQNSKITLQNIVFQSPMSAYDYDSADGDGVNNIGTVYANISAGGNTASFSYVFNNENTVTVTGTYQTDWVSISPSWTFADSNPLTVALNITVVAYDYSLGIQAPDSSVVETSTSESGNSILGTSQPSSESVPFVYGWKFNSQSTSFTIPQYESSFDVTWSSSPSSNPTYNGQSPTGT